MLLPHRFWVSRLEGPSPDAAVPQSCFPAAWLEQEGLAWRNRRGWWGSFQRPGLPQGRYGVTGSSWKGRMQHSQGRKRVRGRACSEGLRRSTPPPPLLRGRESRSQATRGRIPPCLAGEHGRLQSGARHPVGRPPHFSRGARSAWARNGARRLLSPARRLRGWGGGASPAPPFPSAGGGVPSELGGPAGFGALGDLSPPLLCGWPRPSRCEGTPRRWR